MAGFRGLVLLTLISITGAVAADEASSPPLEVTTLAELPGGVGGVTVDRLGYIYVADFGETVFRVDPFGSVTTLTTSLYGASGNTIDGEGHLIQSSFFAGTLSRVARDGSLTTIARGLEGPVGVSIRDDGDFVVCGCNGQKLQRVTETGEVSDFAVSDLFKCPNGITRSPDGTMYVVSFRSSVVVEVDLDGNVKELVTLQSPGNGHIVWAAGDLYVTSFRGQKVFKVTTDGESSVVAGDGRFAVVDGAGTAASFANPNGIAYDPIRDVLYTNDYVTPFLDRNRLPKQSKVRRIAFPGLTERVTTALESGGVEAAVAAQRAYKSGRPGKFTEIELNILGYQLLGQGNVEAAVALFTLNSEDYPSSFNTWDSLAEATAAAGDTARAMEFYRKSLELNPGNQNAAQMLEKLAQ